MVAESSHVLTVVVPALNEADAIGATIRRCLDAREHIIETSTVDRVEIIVVSDGSTDRTEEIARGFEDVTVLVFEKNRGYGAAIMAGFAHGSGDLVSFLDADGTCDPLFFAQMCRALDEQQADLVLGSRVGEESRMPWIRVLGNTIFAWVLGILSQHSVDDTASGMRVIRRSVLPDLYPLPDGLHFTPAMSARVLMEGKLSLVELPMRYSERVGQSKLSVARDGIRFLSCIVRAAVAYRPARPLLLLAAVLAIMALALAAVPIGFYLGEHRLEEWMIYRMLLSSLLATVTSVLVMAAVLADRIAAAAYGRKVGEGWITGVVVRLFGRRNRRIGSIALIGAAVAIVWPGIVEYSLLGTVHMHWSRAVLASLLLVLALMLAVTTFLVHMMELIEVQRVAGEPPRPPDRTYEAAG